MIGSKNQILNEIDIGIFFIYQNYSIQASFPTRIGEFLSKNIPIICNNFNKEINFLEKDNKFIFFYESEKNTKNLLKKIESYFLNNKLNLLPRIYVKKFLSTNVAIEKYLNVYNDLII